MRCGFGGPGWGSLGWWVGGLIFWTWLVMLGHVVGFRGVGGCFGLGMVDFGLGRAGFALGRPGWL